MTITRSFLPIVLVAGMGALGWAGTVAAQQPPIAAPVPVASTAKPNAPTLKAKPHVQVTARNVSPKRATTTADVDKNHLGDSYVPNQHALIDQYQNAVTPPPIDIGR